MSCAKGNSAKPDANALTHRSGQRYRGRFAPSPTGPLHLGSLYTALASFLQAKARDGEWLLRIDDLDPDRSVRAAADAIQRTLERFGLYWDGDVTSQRDRLDHYHQAFAHLQHLGLLYGCRCSRRVLSGKAVYPGYCRDQDSSNDTTANTARIRTAGTVIRFTDRLHGIIAHDLARQTGDFVVRRRDGVFAYHLATVADDAVAGISEVVRGADLLDSTPRQIYLQQTLGLPTPDYCHTPVLTDAAGEKLSKQRFAAPVSDTAPGATLYSLLRLLRQAPPADLQRAQPAEILQWAVGHWDISPLRHVKNICVPSGQQAASANEDAHGFQDFSARAQWTGG